MKASTIIVLYVINSGRTRFVCRKYKKGHESHLYRLKTFTVFIFEELHISQWVKTQS